ncbi:HCL276Cp [Eremothecium sinecaudum]|uniref:HCL276Cp n=1 Tax=Eremothecium sinecaudum TaxID=45286 RepID=A0A120K1Y6_9SACH|nr:HCL276Cp [Eremothecium sinecaudum]AMD19875.1 HCL276Cp [Eremothecium sinecaudum]
MIKVTEKELLAKLKLIAKALLLLLSINLFFKIIRKPFLPWLHNWLLTCSEELCTVYWWQRISFLEPIVWNLIDYIEINYMTRTDM